MSNSKTVKVAAEPARDLPEIDHLGRQIGFDAKPNGENFQVSQRRQRRDKDLGSLRTGKRRELRLVELDVGGRRLLEFREWFLDHSGIWRPSRDNLTLPTALFGDFIAFQLVAAKAGTP